MTTLGRFKKISFLTENYVVCRQFSNQCILHQNIDKKQEPVATYAADLPGPPKLPIIGNMLYMKLHKEFDKKKLFNMYKSLDKDYGPTYKFHMIGYEPIVVFSRPEDVREMYNVTGSNPVRRGLDSLRHVRYNAEGNVFDKKSGLLSENEAEWYRVRSKVQGPILKLQNIYTYLPLMDEVSVEFVNRISEMLDEKDEAPENFLKELYKWALENIGAVSLNTRLGCLTKNLPDDSEQCRLIEAIDSLLENLYKTEIFPIWKIYKNKSYKELVKVHEFVYRITKKNIILAEAALHQSKGKHSRPNILQALLQIDGLSRTDIITMIMDMFAAGIDTTSHTIAFVLYLLSNNPESQRRLQKEIDAVLGDGKLPITEADLSKMTFMKACVKESLRLFPTVMEVIRQFQSDVVINNLHIPKGWHGMFLNIIMGRKESLFTNAEEFIPERWLKGWSLGKSHPYSFLPFSHGSRNCIGRRLAEQEIFILLARILQRYDVKYNYGEMECNQHAVLIPAKPLKFQFTARK